MNASVLSAALALAILSGCASPPIVLAPVGPAPVEKTAHVSTGRLQVFSAAEARADGDDTYYYPHTGYSIFSDVGRRLKYVNNHVGTMDESPAVVPLPTGHYRIVAQSEAYGRVTVPVVIESGRTTTIHLERDWKPAANLSRNVVRLPDGEAVGWSAKIHS
jgi:hypothetical protein